MARMRVLYRSRAQHSEGPRPGSLQTACLPRDTIEESRGPVAMLRSAGIAGRDADGPNRTAETVFRSLFLGPGPIKMHEKIGRAQVGNPVTNAQLVCRIPLENKK